MKSLQERFESRVIKSKVDSCWGFVGSPQQGGYGRISKVINGKQISYLAHRVSYELYREKIPENLCIDHLCRNRNCVNPHHLEIVSRRENTLRSPIAPAAKNFRKKICPKGHKYLGKNLYIAPDGSRKCKTCRKNRQKEMEWKKKIVTA